MRNKLCLFYIPFPNQKSANKIANELVEKKLVACAQLIQAVSVYEWNQKKVNDKETILILKTLKKKKKTIESYLLKHHPYELPCIINYSVNVNENYLDWVKSTLL